MFLIKIVDDPTANWSKESLVLCTLRTLEEAKEEWDEEGKELTYYPIADLTEWPQELPFLDAEVSDA